MSSVATCGCLSAKSTPKKDVKGAVLPKVKIQLLSSRPHAEGTANISEASQQNSAATDGNRKWLHIARPG